MVELNNKSLSGTQKLIQEIMKQSDNKIFEQLDDLKFGSLAKEIHRVKQTTMPKQNKEK